VKTYDVTFRMHVPNESTAREVNGVLERAVRLAGYEPVSSKCEQVVASVLQESEEGDT
jgi:hypothetical protein